jgi:hypothetical protein
MPYQIKVDVRSFGLTLGSLSSATNASSSSPQGPTSLTMLTMQYYLELTSSIDGDLT